MMIFGLEREVMTCHEIDVPTMVSIKIMVFLDVTLCSLVRWY
jgi:hypothetical protein